MEVRDISSTSLPDDGYFLKFCVQEVGMDDYW